MSKKEERKFEIEYKGAWASVNTLRNNNYKVNDALKKKFRSLYSKMILEKKCKGKCFSRFSVDVQFNSRLDTDNVSLKFFVDALKDSGVIIDDNKKYFRELRIRPNEELKFNTYLITVTEV